MEFFISGYSALRGDKGQPQSATETIEKLCDRAHHSSLLEDRRSAIQGLRGLARDWKLDVGTKGMSILIHILKTDRMDVEIIKMTLETLNILCTKDKQNDDENDMGTMFTEIYFKDAANVSLLLDILGEVDFYVRFNSVQLLTTLMQNAGTQLQDAILTSPMGISRLIDLLDDRREIVRNEGLLLLIALTKSNAEIQKIIAFENAFERLFAIILDEGATDGGIIVQDCLNLMQNLLRYNVSNQNLFRETSCIKQLGRLLVSKVISPDKKGTVDLPLTHERTEWTEQKISNVKAALELIRILVAPKNPNTTANQTSLGSAKILEPLVQLGMALHSPQRVRSESLFTVAEMIRCHPVNQETFSKSLVTAVNRAEQSGIPKQKQPPGAPKSSVLSVISLALGKDDFELRAAAAYTFQCFVFRNQDAQLALVSTLIPPPPDNPNSDVSEAPVSPGSLLVSAILDLEALRKDSFRGWFASMMLTHLLLDNAASKELALSVKFEEGEEFISLLHKCMFTLLVANRENMHVRIQVGLLSLLAVWFYDSPATVKEFLAEGSNMQFLIEQVNQSSGVDELVQGLAAFLIGLCHRFNDNSDPVFSKESLKSLVTSRIGADVFQSRLERLREAKQLTSTCLSIVNADVVVDPKTGPELYFDYSFAEFYKSTYDAICRSVTASPGHSSKSMAKSGSGGMVSADLPTQKEIEKMKKTIATQSKELETLKSTIASLKLELQAKEEAFSELEKEQEDLLVCLAEQDMESAELKKRLRAYGEVIEDEEDDDATID